MTTYTSATNGGIAGLSGSPGSITVTYDPVTDSGPEPATTTTTTTTTTPTTAAAAPVVAEPTFTG